MCDLQCSRTEFRLLEVSLLLQVKVKSRRSAQISLFARYRAVSDVWKTERSRRMEQFDVRRWLIFISSRTNAVPSQRV